MNTHQRNFALSFAIILLLSGCAQHPPHSNVLEPYGFFSGLWHGFIVLPLWAYTTVSGWFPSIFPDHFTFVNGVIEIDFEIARYFGKPNTGLGYNIGYGIGAIYGSFIWVSALVNMLREVFQDTKKQ